MPLIKAPFLFPRRPLVVLVILVIAVFVLRAFLRVPFSDSAFGRTGFRSQISLLTYNIWRSPEKMLQRIEALGQIVEHFEPDILAFQEITPENLAVLREQSWLSRYHSIPPRVTKQVAKSLENYIFSLYPVNKWFIYSYRTFLGRERQLVVAETKSAVSSSLKFVVAGTHLEPAGENTRLRELQLQELFTVLSAYENVCVMGDLNIEDKVDGEVVLPSPWIDAWLSLPGNTDSNGLTWDRSKTPFASVLRKTINATSYKARLDRVLCRLSDFKVKEMRIVGDKLTKSGILPSDHFGVLTVIERSVSTGKKRHKHSQPEQVVYFQRPIGFEKFVPKEKRGLLLNP